MKIIRSTLLMLVVTCIGFGGAVHARDLTIALSADITSMDPQFHNLTSNKQLSLTLFDPLVRTDANSKPFPSLAESWSVDGNVWIFKLRPNVTFSDGSPLTADDVVFTYDRVAKVPNSPSSFSLFLSTVATVEAIDPLTVKITTKAPSPVLLANLAQLPIMSRKSMTGSVPEGKTTVELNRGEGLIGTGPYKFVSWKRGAKIIFTRNEHYWGEQPEWDNIIYRPITNPAARVAALLAGDVDLIENPPTDDLPKLKSNKNLFIQETPSVRLIYLALSVSKELPKGVSETDGKNPFLDRRVREALSLAIDRQAIVERIMGNAAQAAGDLLPYPSFGTAKELSVAASSDVSKAKDLLTQAGYPNGFSMSLGSPAGRYNNDKNIAQAVAAMWARIGIKVDLETMAPPVYFKERNAFAFSAYLSGWAPSTGEMLSPLTALLTSRDPELGLGTSNFSHYSNPELDQLVAQASQTLEDEKRSEMLKKASRMAMSDFVLLPLHFELSVWAMKKNIRYAGRSNQMTWAQDITLLK